MRDTRKDNYLEASDRLQNTILSPYKSTKYSNEVVRNAAVNEEIVCYVRHKSQCCVKMYDIGLTHDTI